MIDYRISGNLGVLSLNNPKVNALSFSLLAELDSKFRAFEANAVVEAIVFTSAMDTIFSAGADVKEIMKLSLSKDRKSAESVLEWLHRFFSDIANCSKPTVAAINGLCLGGGLELALACKYRVAGKQTSFGLPEVSLGIIPGLGGTQRLPRLVGAKAALDIILAGNDQRISADRAKEIGLVDKVVEGDFIKGVKDFIVNELISAASRRPLSPLLGCSRLTVESLQFNKPSHAAFSVMHLVRRAFDGHAFFELEEGLAKEREEFLYCLFHDETRKRFKRMRRQAAVAKFKKSLGVAWQKIKGCCGGRSISS